MGERKRQIPSITHRVMCERNIHQEQSGFFLFFERAKSVFAQHFLKFSSVTHIH